MQRRDAVITMLKPFLLPLSLMNRTLIRHASSKSAASNIINLTSSGNTYKNMYEQTSMSSGLTFVILVNLVTSCFLLLFYRYFILRGAGLLEPEDIELLKKYPTVHSAKAYTPAAAYVRGAPPMRWTGWRDFFTSCEARLSRDAQIYLLFQRSCIFTTSICAAISTVVLLPSYWWGGAVFKTKGESLPHSLMSLLRTDRGVFERFTSHNLSADSPLNLLQLPVIVVTAMCIIVMYTVVKTGAGEERSVSEWLQSSSPQPASPLNLIDSPKKSASSPRSRQWMLFARGLPRTIQTAGELTEMLEALYPGQVVKVELVCKGRTSEAKLLRSLSASRNRLDYLRENLDNANPEEHAPPNVMGKFFRLFTKHRNTASTIADLEEKIRGLQDDLESRRVETAVDFMGCAFISFRSSSAASSVLNNFPVRFDRTIYDRSLSHSEMFDGITIGRHHRDRSEWEIPALNSLYRGVLNLLPRNTRQQFIYSPRLGPVREQESNSRLLESPIPRAAISPELATAKLRNMKAERAPKSGDIIWSNIGISFFERTLRELLVQFVVFAVLILFTSPVAMLTAMKLVFAELSLLSDPQIFNNHGHHNGTSPISLSSSLNETNGFELLNNITSNGYTAVSSLATDILQILPSFFSSNSMLRSLSLTYLPVLLLAIVFSLVPSILRLTCSLEGYSTQSAQEISVFRKTSFYYIMNAVVLPSLALNTASEFLSMIYKQSNGGANVYNALPILQRLFSGDIAFFLCNYLVQLALNGSVLWLMRLPSSLSMMVRHKLAVTPLEAAEAKCTDIFDYPRHYAYSVTVMSMCLLFGFMAPLVWHFSWLYFVCKHAVDVYLIRYVHPTSHIDGGLPRLSANFILTWTVVSQLSLSVIFYLQGWVKVGISTAVFCFLTLIICLSAGARVGNRILGFIGELRDKAIVGFMRSVGKDYQWLRDSSMIASSSTSSSTQSFTACQEGDALLSKSCQLETEIKAMKCIQTSSVGTDSPPQERVIGKQLFQSLDSAFVESNGTNEALVDRDGYDSMNEEDQAAVIENIEAGNINSNPYYGT